MSSKNKKRSAQEAQDLMDKEFVPVDERNQCLQTAIYQTTRLQPFLGAVLQSMNMMYTWQLPTAGVSFNADYKRWDLFINPFFFCKRLSADNRVAVLLHEIMHITHQHPFRLPFSKISPQARQLMNIAADMAINQYIQNIPNGCPQCPPDEMAQQGAECPNELCPGKCIDVKNYYDENKSGAKTPWPEFKPTELYYDKLTTKFKDINNDSECDGDCDNCEQKSGDSKDGGKGKGKKCPGKNPGDTLDNHDWDGSGSEKDMLEATEDLVKRAMIKQRLNYDDLPGCIKDLLKDINSKKAELNYKALILSAIKRSASGHERKHAWTRKSKRYGNKAPGTKEGDMPKLEIFLDTSGSISTEELNQFLTIVDEFLKAGSRKCFLNLFHTRNYHREEYKLGRRLDKNVVESGGTDLEDSMMTILKYKPDLSVVVSDGCYGDVEVEKHMNPNDKFPQTLFVISEQGDERHPLQRLGSTIKIPGKIRS